MSHDPQSPTDAADFHDDDYLPDDDEGGLDDECGMMPDGYCSLAGSEWCDWNCPLGGPEQ